MVEFSMAAKVKIIVEIIHIDSGLNVFLACWLQAAGGIYRVPHRSLF